MVTVPNTLSSGEGIQMIKAPGSTRIIYMKISWRPTIAQPLQLEVAFTEGGTYLAGFHVDIL